MGLLDLLKKQKVSTMVDTNSSTQIENGLETNLSDKNNILVEEIRLDDINLKKIKSKFIAFDIETTGLDSYNDRIIELGATFFEDFNIKEIFSTLINPNKLNSEDAMSVNNISNEMILNAPNEYEVYKKFVDFIGKDGLSGNTIFCAHNGIFDFKFLANALNRLGYSGTIRYIDTLKVARNCIYDVEDYKLGTLADYFNLVNKNAHRASDDAEICGRLLINLVPFVERKNEQINKKIEKQVFSEIEYMICSYIQKKIISNGLKLGFLKYEKVSGDYISCKYLYNFLKFKVTKNGVYFLVKKEYADNLNLLVDNASISEGGIEYSRVYVTSFNDIDLIENYIVSEYKEIIKYAEDYMNNSEYKIQRVEEFMSTMVEISVDDMNLYLKKINTINLPSINVKVKKNINRNEIIINPINSRKNINDIKIKNVYSFEKYDDYVKAMDEFYKICSIIDNYISDKNYIKALELLDKTREDGYLFGYLYDKYVKLYSQLKDYDNIIDIIEEAIPIMKSNNEHITAMETKLQNVINQKYKVESERLEQEKKKLEKQLLKEKTIQLKKKKKETTSKKRDTIEGRHVIQLDDDGNTIKSYVSVAEAVRDTGINSKSIRDAANGVQKHAGGYVWKYDNDEN